MKLMKRAVAVALMSLLASGMIACEQKKESTEAPAADVQAPAQEAQPAMEEEIQPPAEEGLADVPSPDSEPPAEQVPAPAEEHK